MIIPAACAGQKPPVSEDLVFPFGWKVVAVPAAEASQLLVHWPVQPERGGGGKCLLRITVAHDIRFVARIEATLAVSGKRLGVFDVRYGCLFDPAELVLSGADTAAVLREGVALRCIEGKKVWIFATGSEDEPATTGPHLLTGPAVQPSGTARWEAAYRLLASVASIQPFGWQEGCALEGLEAVATADPGRRQAVESAIAERLALYFAAPKLTYLDPRGGLVNETLQDNVELGLMIPSALRYLPGHPAISQFVELASARAQRELDAPADCDLTAEGCYTLAYPLAVAARLQQDDHLADLAVSSLIARLDHLSRPDGLYLRRHANGDLVMRNWLRGCAWLTLGTARTLEVLAPVANTQVGRAEVKKHLQPILATLLDHQRRDGLWNCFIDEPRTGPETSGSAGVAAALVIASQLAVTGTDAMTAAQRCAAALTESLTDDGRFGGVTQGNKGEAGIALQRHGYRIHSHMGLGLAVQLSARLQAPTRTAVTTEGDFVPNPATDTEAAF